MKIIGYVVRRSWPDGGQVIAGGGEIASSSESAENRLRIWCENSDWGGNEDAFEVVALVSTADVSAVGDLDAAIERAAIVQYERSYGSWGDAVERKRQRARQRVRPIVLAALGLAP